MLEVGQSSSGDGSRVEERRSEPHLSPVLTAGRLPLFWWIMVILGGGALLSTLSRLELVELLTAGDGLWLAFGLILLGELRPVASSQRDPDGINLSTAFLFAVLLRWGPELAVLGVLLATAVGELVRGKPLYRLLFNVAQYTISYLAAWVVLAAAGWRAEPTSPAVLQPADLGLVLLAAVTYHAVNHLLVASAVALTRGCGLRQALREDLAWYSMITGAVMALSPLIVVVLQTDWRFLPLIILPLGLTVATAKLALERESRGLVDEMTGVANRSRLATIVAERASGGSSSDPAVLCLVDLDRFKEVNDTLGHAMGDDLLRAVAARMRAACRDQDVVARLGGDEFVLLLDVADARTAMPILERLAASVRSPYDLGGARLEVELSIGVASFPAHGSDLASLLRRADLAMYEAKSSGELLSCFRTEMDRRTPSTLQLLADLRRGLAAGELELHYQPQVALPGGEVLGAEGLLRWRHPELGLLAPGRFLPLAERTATMREVTATTLELGLAQLARWDRIGLALPIALNVSLHDLADGRFAASVEEGLARHGVAPGRLHLEITEQALVSDPTRVLSTLEELHAAGITLSLDDFGTGHASLTRLKRLPVTEVKIDRQFVADLHDEGGQDAAIVRSVVELARALGLRTVAEGVESATQWEVLSALGCDAAQGWYVAGAMEPDDATAWLLARLESVAVADGHATGPRMTVS